MMPRPNFISDAAWSTLLVNGAHTAQGDEGDPVPAVRLVLPGTNASWLLTEADPAETDRAFGLCDLGLGFPELGYVSLDELSQVRGPAGSSVTTDEQFRTGEALSVHAARARRARQIVS